MKQLKKDIKAGMSKDDAFKSLKNRGGKAKQASAYLARLSEPSLVQKYSKANYTLIIAYGLITFVSILAVLPQLSSFSVGGILSILALDLLIFGFIAYMVYKGQAYGYIIVAVFMAKGCLGLIGGYQNEPTTIGLVFLAINIAILVFAVTLKGKLFPKQNFFNLKKDESGNYIFNHI